MMLSLSGTAQSPARGATGVINDAGAVGVSCTIAFHGDFGSIADAGVARHDKQYREQLVKYAQIMETVHQPFHIVGIQEVG